MTVDSATGTSTAAFSAAFSAISHPRSISVWWNSPSPSLASQPERIDLKMGESLPARTVAPLPVPLAA